MGLYLGRQSHNLYGYAIRGEEVYTRSCLEDNQIKMNVIGALQNGVAGNFLMIDGNVDSNVFETWFMTNLLPSLSYSSTIIMDNAFSS